MKAKDAGDEEAMYYDADFIRAWNTACHRPAAAVSGLIA